MRASRTVEFVVVSDRHSEVHLTSVIPVPPDRAERGTGRFAHEAVWAIQASGAGDSDLSELIEAVLTRLAPATSSIRALAAQDGIVVILRIIQYLRDDPVGPGFALSVDAVRRIADLGAMLDVDQYLDLT